MFEKIFKGLLSGALLLVIGVVAILEIVIEVIYQLVRLFRRGYGYLIEQFLKLIEPIYNGQIHIKPIKKDDTDDIKIYEINY